MIKIALATLGIVLFMDVIATADSESCRGASYVFKSAKNNVGDYLRRYASCISRSNGHDDCSRDFARLRSAQDDFELTVSDYNRECL